MIGRSVYGDSFLRYLNLMVPRTWLYALLSFMFGYLISGGQNVILLTIGVLLFGPVLTGATNLINMYYDVREDEINKPTRKEHLSKLGNENVRLSAFILYFVGICMSLAFSSPTFTLFILTYIIISYTYSAPPLRFKKRFLISLFMLAYGSVFLPFISAWTLEGKEIMHAPWGLATMATVIVLFPIAGKDITDPRGDKKAGNSTIFTVLNFGEGVKLYCRLFLWLPYVVLAVLLLLNMIPPYMSALFLFVPITYMDMRNGLKISSFDESITKKYFRSAFWHIMELLTFSFLLPLIIPLIFG